MFWPEAYPRGVGGGGMGCCRAAAPGFGRWQYRSL